MTNSKPSELLFDRYLLGETTEQEISIVNDWLRSNPDAHNYIINRKKQAEQAVVPVPTFKQLEQHVQLRRQTAQPFFKKIRFITLPSISVISAVLLITITFHMYNRNSIIWNTKGGNQISCIIKHTDTFTKVKDTALCFTGDTLQVYSQSPHNFYIAVFYSEQSNTYISANPSDSALLMSSSSTPVPLPFSLVVDTTIGLIQIDVISSPKPFSIQEGLSFLQKNSTKYLKKRFVLIRRHP